MTEAKITNILLTDNLCIEITGIKNPYLSGSGNLSENCHSELLSESKVSILFKKQMLKQVQHDKILVLGQTRGY